MLASMAGSFLFIALIIGTAAFWVGVPLLALKVMDWLNARRFADAVARSDFEEAEEHAGRSLYYANVSPPGRGVRGAGNAGPSG